MKRLNLKFFVFFIFLSINFYLNGKFSKDLKTVSVILTGFFVFNKLNELERKGSCNLDLEENSFDFLISAFPIIYLGCEKLLNKGFKGFNEIVYLIFFKNLQKIKI